MDYHWVWERIGEYHRFATVREIWDEADRLVALAPDRVRLTVVGRSRGGAPLRALRIGRGARQALWIGCPHPNEPIGALTVLAFARLLVTEVALDDLEYAWTLVPCVDPDGTRLNEGWFAAPGSVREYARCFYRPEMAQQVEWTFPCRCEDLVFDAPLPETRAVMDLIDQLRPRFLYSLHNAGFGGMYFYLSGPAPGLYEALSAVGAASGLRMHRGEPEVAYAAALAPSVYHMPTVRQAYDFFQAQRVDPKAATQGGMASAEYAAARCGAFSLVAEVPYFDDDRVDSQDATGIPRRQSIGFGLTLLREFLGIVDETLGAVRGHLAHTPFLTAISALAAHLPQRLAALEAWVRTDPGLQRPASVAELFYSRTVLRFYHALNLGMLARALGYPANPSHAGLVAAHERRVAGLRDEWVERILQETPCRPLPIRTLVAAQLASGLAAARYLQAGSAAAL